MYIPKNTSLESQDKVDNETSERVILTFAGANPFVFVQETSKMNDNMVITPVEGEPVLLTSGVGAITDSSVSWIDNNVEYYVMTSSLSQEEMLSVVNSVSVMPIGK